MSSGASPRLSGGRVKEQLVVLKRVDHAGNVAHKRLSLFGRHGSREPAALRRKMEGHVESVGTRPKIAALRKPLSFVIFCHGCEKFKTATYNAEGN